MWLGGLGKGGLAKGFCWRACRLFIASPQPLSMAFGIGDFEDHGEGRFRSALPNGEASASGRNVDAAFHCVPLAGASGWGDSGNSLGILLAGCIGSVISMKITN